MNKIMLNKFKGILIYIILFIIVLCGTMFFIKNNLNTQTPASFQTIVKKGGTQVYDYKFLGFIMQSTTVTIEDSGIIEVDSKNLPPLFYIPILISITILFFIYAIITLIKHHTSKLKL